MGETYSAEAIAEILKEIKDTTTEPDKIKLVGTARPDATPDQISDRRERIYNSRRTREWIVAHSIEHTMEASSKVVSNELEYLPIYIANAIVTDSWQEGFLSEYYGSEEYRKIAQRTQNHQSFVQARLADVQEELGDDYYLEIANYILEQANRELTKIEKHQHGSLTYGMEFEVMNISNPKTKTQRDQEFLQVQRLDALQDLGIPMAHDGLREVPLPKSKSSYEQMRAFSDLVKMHAINPEQYVNVHLNVGGIPYFDENVVLMDQIIHAANIFGEEIHVGREITPSIYSSKPLFEDDYFSPSGLPFKVRKNGVLEIRDLPQIGAQNSEMARHVKNGLRLVPFKQYARGIEIIADMCECIAAYQRVYPERCQDYLLEHWRIKDQNIAFLPKSTDPRDIELAGIWANFKNAVVNEFKTHWGRSSQDIFESIDDVPWYYAELELIRDSVAVDSRDPHSKAKCGAMNELVFDLRVKKSEAMTKQKGESTS